MLNFCRNKHNTVMLVLLKMRSGENIGRMLHERVDRGCYVDEEARPRDFFPPDVKVHFEENRSWPECWDWGSVEIIWMVTSLRKNGIKCVV